MTNIYVGNLDYSTPEDQLQTLFAAYGAVKTVTAVTDRDTGQPRGFAFVEMTGAIVSNGWGDDVVGCYCASIRENSTYFQTGLPSETVGNYEHRQL